jgi:Ca2+:H+ antiporter
LSICTALVLMSAYIGSLIYAFARQKDLLRPTKQERGESGLTSTHAAMLLAIGTILTTIQAEMLVGALGPALTEFGFTEMFVGVIVVAIIGNAAEHYSAIVAAHRDNMTLAVEISIGSSAQIALFVGPAVVLYSYAIGRPMTLLFNAFEIASIALSVLATHMAVLDGESNWVEGMQLMSVYMILAFAFYFVP